jgi:hypothetical protein
MFMQNFSSLVSTQTDKFWTNFQVNLKLYLRKFLNFPFRKKSLYPKSHLSPKYELSCIFTINRKFRVATKIESTFFLVFNKLPGSRNRAKWLFIISMKFPIDRISSCCFEKYELLNTSLHIFFSSILRMK